MELSSSRFKKTSMKYPAFVTSCHLWHLVLSDVCRIRRISISYIYIQTSALHSDVVTCTCVLYFHPAWVYSDTAIVCVLQLHPLCTFLHSKVYSKFEIPFQKLSLPIYWKNDAAVHCVMFCVFIVIITTIH
jgi:hypothetical protein